MPVVPKDNLGRIAFYEQHAGPWAAAADELGLSTSEVEHLADRTAAARAAYARQRALMSALRAATVDVNEQVALLARAGADLILKIRATASSGGNDIYATAQIPPSADPAPIGPPGTPTNFTVKLNPVGSLTLRWQCAHPKGAQGTMYEIARRVDDDGAGGQGGAAGPGGFVPLGTIGAKSFVDATLPAGAVRVTYEIRAVRSTATGMAAQFPVNIGIDAGVVTAKRAA